MNGTFAKIEAALLAMRGDPRRTPTPRKRVAGVFAGLGLPQRALDVIHITGTNGKSSTAWMMASMLTAAGLRVGCFTSPHWASIRERIVVDGKPIAEHALLALNARLQPVGVGLSFFEYMTVMALCHFLDQRVNVGIIEVGIGGARDATNAIDGEVAVITTVGRDHVEILGGDLRLIAHEKTGIVKRDATVIIGDQPDNLAAVIATRAYERGARQILQVGSDVKVRDRRTLEGRQYLSVETPSAGYRELMLPMLGAHQASNLATAVAGAEAFLHRRVSGLASYHVRTATAKLGARGRLEVISTHPLKIIDASHNPSGMAATVRALQEAFPRRRFSTVLALAASKDAAGITAEIAPIASTIIATENGGSFALPAYRLARTIAQTLGPERVIVEPDFDRALRRVSCETLDPVLITGSFVTAARARAHLRADGCTQAGNPLERQLNAQDVLEDA